MACIEHFILKEICLCSIIWECHGIESESMSIVHELIQSVHFRRVLEGIRDAANKMTPQSERAFFGTMPFELVEQYSFISLIYLDFPSLEIEYGCEGDGCNQSSIESMR